MLVQVLGGCDDEVEQGRVEAQLRARADTLQARSRLIVGEDIAAAIVEAGRAEAADVLVVGNSGMHGRTEFLLGNVANRVTHSARCTTVVVQSSTEPEDESPPDRAMDTRRMARTAEILRVLSRIGLRNALRGGGPDAEARASARRLRAGLEELGPVFCKLGQILSTRPDLLPSEYIDELAALRNNVPPLPEAEVVKVMEQELLVPWEDVFGSVDPKPLAAGTIGQVHRATLANGARVVVKVQRPAAAGIIHRDLELLHTVARGMGASRRVRSVIDLPALVGELAASITEELDFLHEAQHLDRMAELLKEFPHLGVPRPHHDLSTQRLLVMDEVIGVPVDQAPAGPDREAAARELLAACFHQVLSAGFFHADPHPGNLMWADGRIWLLDLGMVGEIDDTTRRQLLLLLLALWQGDAGFLTDLTLALAPGAGVVGVDVEALEAALVELVDSLKGASLAEIEIGPLLQRITEISVRHEVPIPTSLAMVGKALSQVQLTVVELAPDIDLFDEARRFFTRDLLRRLTGAGDPAALALRGREAPPSADDHVRRHRDRWRRSAWAAARGRLLVRTARAHPCADWAHGGHWAGRGLGRPRVPRWWRQAQARVTAAAPERGNQSPPKSGELAGAGEGR